MSNTLNKPFSPRYIKTKYRTCTNSSSRKKELIGYDH
ncbi:hypothetical protein NC651_016706 [Populus alba x Populus x berolinensis]|nr:hypothetical protein NC651_016706 [Populus alba x Populus x berolinensis]